MFRRDVLAALDQHLHVVLVLEFREAPPLAVVEVAGDLFLDRHRDPRDPFVLGAHQELADDFDRHALGAFYQAGAVAAGTFFIYAPLEARPDALAGHFDEAEGAGPQNLSTGAIALHRVAER